MAALQWLFPVAVTSSAGAWQTECKVGLGKWTVEGGGSNGIKRKSSMKPQILPCSLMWGFFLFITGIAMCCVVRHVTPAQVLTISPKNVSNLPTSLVVSRREGRPLDRGCECILLLCLILWMTWYKSMLSSAGNRRQSWVPHSGSISWK